MACDGSGLIVVPTADGPDKLACIDKDCPHCRSEKAEKR